MPINAVLAALIGKLNSVDSLVYVDWNSTQEWPEKALESLLMNGILVKASNVQSIECQVCEHRCFKDVIFQTDAAISSTRAFIVCEEPDMQEQIGKIPLQLEQLRQWKTSVQQMARVVAGMLGFNKEIDRNVDQDNIRLGMLKGNKGRCWISLRTDPLILELNGLEMPLQEVLYFDQDNLLIDQDRLDACLNRPSNKGGKRYSPSTDRRESRKLITQAMYQDWKDEYRSLKKKRPGMGDVWFSKQIAKMDIAKNRDSETIRHNMKG